MTDRNLITDNEAMKVYLVIGCILTGVLVTSIFLTNNLLQLLGMSFLFYFTMPFIAYAVCLVWERKRLKTKPWRLLPR